MTKRAKNVAGVRREYFRVRDDPAELRSLMLRWTRSGLPAALDRWGGLLIMATNADGVTRIARPGGIIASFRMDDLRQPERDLVTLLCQELQNEAAFTLAAYALLESEAGAAKGRSVGGMETAKARKAKAAGDDTKLLLEARRVRAKHPDISTRSLAQHLSARKFGRAETIRKKLQKLLPD
jgi:hypothetical protein